MRGLLLALAGCPWVGAGDLDRKTDEDGDGFAGVRWGGDDCDDGDPLVHPRAEDRPGDLDDDDCDGIVDCWRDGDGDGLAATEPVPAPGDDLDCDDPGESLEPIDCDDARPEVHPGAEDLPANGLDEDCTGDFACWDDDDGDRFGSDQGSPATSADADCDDPGEADVGGDCDDADLAVNPGVDEIAGDLTDEDCDGRVACWTDADDDGFGVPIELPANDADCDDPGESTDGTDCDDAEATAFPGGIEAIGNDIDEDCVGGADCPSGDAEPDGVCDDVDECPGADDGIDSDSDGVADGCDDADDDPDADDDRLPDGREDADHDGVVDPGETDPAAPDSDGDGTCDGPREDNDGDGLAPPVGCESVWFVRPGAPEPIDGFTWDSAFAHPGDALDVVTDGEQVWVAEGTYGARGAATDPIASLGAGVRMFGGFAGDEPTFADRPDPLRESILDGDTNVSGAADAGDALHTVEVGPGGLLDGFVVIGGYADAGPGPDESGGGILVDSGSVTIARTRFAGGAGIGPGGVIHVSPGADLTLLDVDVDGGTAPEGGGVFVAGSLSWTGGSVTGCAATTRGGGISAPGTAVVEDVVISGNSASDGGGLFLAMGGVATLALVDVVENTATVGAGVLLGQASSFTMVSSVVAENVGDGLLADNVPFVLLHGVSVADNSGTGVLESGTAAVTIENSVLWGNALEIGGTPTVASTCVEGGYAGAITVSSDPFTRSALADGSPAWFLTAPGVCVDAGDDGLATAAYGSVGLDWTVMSARFPYAPDATPVDLGRHYPAP